MRVRGMVRLREARVGVGRHVISTRATGRRTSSPGGGGVLAFERQGAGYKN